MSLETGELMSYVVTVIGLPLAIAVFFFEQRKERENEEEEVYQLLSDNYQDFLKIALENPDLRLFSDTNGEFSRDYHAISKEGGDDPALNVFTRRDGVIRHFWSGEMDFGTADPGEDPRGAPDLMPLWTVLDMTPEGRGADASASYRAVVRKGCSRLR